MKNFQAAQLDFTRHLRDPVRYPDVAPLEDRRMGIYRDLVYNNLAGFIAGAFPVLKSILNEAHWQQLVRDFIAEHRAQSPYFLEISQEFLQYLEVRGRKEGDPPFMLELAHYEWIELALDVAEQDLPPRQVGGKGLSASQRLWVSPLAWSLVYAFPVHRLGPSFQPEVPDTEPSLLLAYRNRRDQVKFMALNPVGFALLQHLEESPGIECAILLRQLAQSLAHPRPNELKVTGEALIVQFLAEDILLDQSPEEANF